ncbi:MAG TPA: hypothetical protein VF593_02945 [Chthoniobacteraceae bacterium]|jgi:hypothetical protein
MKIQAVTVCFNYSDFLDCIVTNRQHFDRRLVVTCENDQRIQELSSREGLECVVSRQLLADGSDFRPEDAKWRVINEGLDMLDKCGWAVVLDADVLG